MNLQGSIRIPRRPSDGKDGTPGLPGQIPIQKEWVVGDTHRNTDEIVDYIYVRGANKSTSYWYKLASKGTKDDVGAPPENGEYRAGYERIDWLKELAVKVLIAEESNLAGLIFKNEELISQTGTVGGNSSTDYGNPDFEPNILIDGPNGKFKGIDVEIRGSFESNSSGNRIRIDPSSRRIIFTTHDDFDSGSIGFDAEGALLNLYKRFSASTVYSSSMRLDGYSFLLRKFGQSGNETNSVTISPTGVMVSNASSTCEIRADGIYKNGTKVL